MKMTSSMPSIFERRFAGRYFLLFFIVFLSFPDLLAAQTDSAPKATENSGARDQATKEQLIDSLKGLLRELEKQDWNAAANYVLMPPNLKPADLAGLIRLNEISLPGILRLEREAKFGSAIEIFGEERAARFAKKMGADVMQCFGINHEVEGVTAEVMGLWDGKQFKLVRIDDLGKLPLSKPSTQPPVAATAPASPQPPSTEQLAAQLGTLEAAVTADPDSIPARANYAMALHGLKNFPAAWTQLMAAYQLDPNHTGVQKGIDVLMEDFTKLGVFTVGVPTETVESLLGAPRTKVDLNSRNRYVYAQWAVDFKGDRVHEIVDLRTTGQQDSEPTEVVDIKLDERGWQTGYRKQQRGKATAFMFIPGETMAQYSEQIAIERFSGLAENRTLEQFSDQMIADEKRAIPNIKHKILDRQSDSLILASTIPSVEGSKPRHILVKLLKGPKDLHRLTYSLLSDEPPTNEVQLKWMTLFKAANLKAVTPR